MKPIDLTRAVPDFYTADLRTILKYVSLIRSLNYGSSQKADNHIVNAPLFLFTGDKDTLLPDFDMNAVFWHNHTSGEFSHYYFDGDHFSWYEDGKNAEFLEKFKECLKEKIV